MTIVRRDFRSGTLYLGDVLEVLRLAENVKVDLVLTDPPYCSGGSTLAAKQADTSAKYQQTGTKKRYPEFGGDHLDQRAFVAWCADWGDGHGSCSGRAVSMFSSQTGGSCPLRSMQFSSPVSTGGALCRGTEPNPPGPRGADFAHRPSIWSGRRTGG